MFQSNRIKSEQNINSIIIKKQHTHIYINIYIVNFLFLDSVIKITRVKIKKILLLIGFLIGKSTNRNENRKIKFFFFSFQLNIYSERVVGKKALRTTI